MLSQFSSMLVALLLVIAGATLLVMIEMTEKKGIRRIFGYLLFFFLRWLWLFCLPYPH
ncbi:hypothetical protein H206_00927 [Candidatus Electrothrix aarhusensis]|uniref:Uncharacterized protein n=1 Tax=Candidatus Electrothrix aarhusensis TaxID=1859131 RepID=A0A3S3RQG6_9BACT|nr:hypothetical protein H206_00927 [Candidatus Electrothrix aarhusensis]